MLKIQSNKPLVYSIIPYFLVTHTHNAYRKKHLATWESFHPTAGVGPWVRDNPEAGIHSEGVKKAWPWNAAMNRIDSTLAFLEPKPGGVFGRGWQPGWGDGYRISMEYPWNILAG